MHRGFDVCRADFVPAIAYSPLHGLFLFSPSRLPSKPMRRQIKVMSTQKSNPTCLSLTVEETMHGRRLLDRSMITLSRLKKFRTRDENWASRLVSGRRVVDGAGLHDSGFYSEPRSIYASLHASLPKAATYSCHQVSSPGTLAPASWVAGGLERRKR